MGKCKDYFGTNGNSMFIAAGPYDENKDVAINKITSRFGVTFSGRIENDKELQVSSLSNIFGRLATILAKFYRTFT